MSIFFHTISIYLFTNCSDIRYKFQILLMQCIAMICLQVVFVMTGDCGDNRHVGYQVFEKIASTSSGQVYHLNKTDVDEVCK
jgi:hemicentin